VVNASRQVGAALGLAILGAVGTTLTSDAWSDRVSALPPGLQGQAHRLDELVIGAQGDVVGNVAGARAEQAAFESFVSGVHGAMWVAAALTLAAAVTAFVGLRGTPAARPAPAERPGQVAIEA
jgi:hypothetical protein